MAYLTALEAAQRLGVSEKTVRRWIKNGDLQAIRRASNKLAIAESDIDRIAEDRAQFEDRAPLDLTTLAEQYADLERKYNDLVARVAELERKPRGLEASSSQPSPRPGRPARAQHAPIGDLWSGQDQARAGLPDDLPAGSILASDFAARHNVNRITFRDHMTIGVGRGNQKERAEHIARPHPSRPETVRYLSPAQQHGALLFWQRHNTPYTPCPECPHNEQDAVTVETTAQDDASAAIEDRDL